VDIDIEGRVWKGAALVFGVRLQNLVEEGVNSFKRQPGLHEPTRVYASQVGVAGFEALERALRVRGVAKSWAGTGFIVVRSRLRIHLKRHLQWQLMLAVGRADEISEAYFAGDLGL
jgi:hypothetical protein